ncbi:hypothetical protein F4804DRAFT_121605 [Jackrogersella minutella]|nr:hypothetical protein F4804DRAFT_121605 [Jackrogersella minutella]
MPNTDGGTEAGPSNSSIPEPKDPSAPQEGPGPDEVRCDICYLNFFKPELTTLPCGHTMDSECLMRWTHVDVQEDYRSSRCRCPYCRAFLLYRCGDIISRHHLRPGVRIEPLELTLMCQSYNRETGRHSVSEPRWSRTLGLIWAMQNPRINPDQGNEEAVEQVSSSDDDSEVEVLPPNGPPAPAAVQSRFPRRPNLHKFRFYRHVMGKDQRPFEFERHEITKTFVANALDTDWVFDIDEAVEDAERTMDFVRETFHTYSFADFDYQCFITLRRLWENLKQDHKVFKRQHEGFIHLNAIAVAFRDAQAPRLRRNFEEFYNHFEYCMRMVKAKWREASGSDAPMPKWGEGL